MIWTVIVTYDKQSYSDEKYGSFIMSTANNDLLPSWKMAQEQIGNEGIVIGMIKGNHEVKLSEEIKRRLNA